MKKIIFLFPVLLYLSAFSQSENDIITIREKVEQTNIQSKNYTSIILKTAETLSTEGNEILVFIDGLKNIKLIKETYFSENRKTIIWNYLEANHAYFIYKEYFTYKLLKTDKKFNESKFTKTEEGFYLKNDRIIKWMKGKKMIKKYPTNAANIENNMIVHIEDMKSKYNQQNTK